MMIYKVLLGAACAMTFFTYGAVAADAPSDFVNSAAESVPKLDLDPSGLEDVWIDWANTQPWSHSSYHGGVQDFPQRGIVISSGTAYVTARKGQPGWIDSRMTAFAKADLDARAHLVEFLEQKLTNGRTFELLENHEFKDGQIQDMREVSKISQVLKRWGQKGVRLTDAVLDKLISLSDQDYDPESLNALPPEKQKVIVQEMYSQSLARILTKSLTGVATVFSTEGNDKSEYRVVVGIIWSPNLNSVAWSIRNDADASPTAVPGLNIDQWVSGLGPDLLALWGNRVIVNDKGHYTAVAFAQAELARSSSTREQRAIHRAKEIAENRARAMIANFVEEKIMLKSDQGLNEVYQELEDTSSATEITRKLHKVVQGRKKTLTFRGLRTIKKWSMTHPVSGQKVTGAVVAWSPSSRAMAKRMSESMNHSRRAKQSQAIESPRQAVPSNKPSIKPIVIDTSAY